MALPRGSVIMKSIDLTVETSGTVDFGQRVGNVFLDSLGPDTAYFVVNGDPPTPGFGDGRHPLRANSALFLDMVVCSKVGISVVGGNGGAKISVMAVTG
jgi:hypothetical protein